MQEGRQTEEINWFVTDYVQHNSIMEPKSCLGDKGILLAVQAFERQLKQNNQPAFVFSNDSGNKMFALAEPYPCTIAKGIWSRREHKKWVEDLLQSLVTVTCLKGFLTTVDSQILVKLLGFGYNNPVLFCFLILKKGLYKSRSVN